MFDYLAFIYSGISEPSGNALTDGAKLGRECLRKLAEIDNTERFPPKLLILLASPAYLEKKNAEQLLHGVNRTFREFRDVPLIGSSVGGVFFDQKVHHNGALLICLASKLIEARVASGSNARQNPRRAITELLRGLQLGPSRHPSRQIDPNPLANRLIVTFMPGCNEGATTGTFYPAPELHRLLYEGVQARIWMVGGVSSANDRTRKLDGFQFARHQVLRDSVVAASLITGVPIGISLNDGLINKKKVLRVSQLGKDNRTILEFDKGVPQEQLAFAGNNVMLAKLSADDERTVDIPLPVSNGAVQMLRPVKRGEYFQVFRPGSQIINTALKGIKLATKRVYVERPIASLLFPCKAYNPRTEPGIASAQDALAKIEETLQEESPDDRPCVGGFFDGEIGVDEKGRSRLTNGGVGYVIFGDEIRERTPLYKGVSALAKHGYKLLPELTRASIDVTIRNALYIVSKTGFPGAMLSLTVSNLDRETGEKKRFIIAREAVGVRYSKIKDHTRRSCDGEDILALVWKNGETRFIPDSKKDTSCDPESIEISKLTSQYVLPLKRLNGSMLGILQVDLGDLHHITAEEFRKTEKARMLDCFGEVFSASINRIANAVETKIKLDLDTALERSLSATSLHQGVERFFRAAGKAFGVEMGHLRLVKSSNSKSSEPKQSLVLETGFGACYEAEKSKRHEIDADDYSPICCAFRSKEPHPHIVNDVSTDPAFQAMLQSVGNDRKLYTQLRQTNSYAAVAFRDERGRQIGALSFGSPEPWFFLKLHRAALEALAERLGFLIQHLKARIARNFLLDVSPKLAERDLNDTQRIFRDITTDFRKALKAEVASLYLWDEDTKKYVLRAASNWKDKRWVHAAMYDENSRWIGITAINEEPLYVPDLRKYYLKRKYKFPKGRYANYMFGQPLSNTFSVEAIGLPLRIGPDKTNKFGVLTLYRRIKPGQRTGFVTTDIDLLQEGAYNAAGLVNAVLWNRKDEWEKQEQSRRERVHEGLSANDERSYEGKICHEVLQSFRATEVDFYRIDRAEAAVTYPWIAGYRLRSGNGKPEKLDTASGNHNQIISDTIVVAGKKRSFAVAGRRRELSDSERQDPIVAKTEGLVEQVCIPLIGDKKYIAALVVRWRIKTTKPFSPLVVHDAKHLQILGRILGSAYSRHRIKRQADRSDQAVHTAGLYVFQHAHKLVNAIQTLYRIAQKVNSAKTERDRKIETESLETTAEEYIDTLNWEFELGELIQNPAREPIPLSPFIKHCWKELTKSNRAIDKVEFRVPEGITMVVDPMLIKEVFFNLMTNAIKATQRKKEKAKISSRLVVSAAVSEDKETITLSFKDNGVGMSPKQIENAFRGFTPSGRKFRNVSRKRFGKFIRHKGVGVLISLYLLRVQDGGLRYVSKRGKGVEAIVTLPNFRPREEKR